MKLFLFGTALSLLALTAVAADDDHQRVTTIGATYGQERLSNNFPDWHERTLQIQHQIEKHHLVGLEVADFERFGMRDARFGVSYTRPLNKQLTATIDAGFSSTRRVIAKNTFGAALQIEFAPAWLFHLGGRTTNYDAVTVNQALVGLEHYFTHFSWAATLRPARAFGETAVSGSLRGSYYYGERNSINLIASSGEEAANFGRRVILAQVRGIAVTGRHWLDRRWALSYSANHTRQGDFYSRRGIQLGIHYAF